MKVIAQNKKAWFDYEVLEELEAGLVLNGYEIKSIRNGKVSLQGSHAGAGIYDKENLYVKGMNIQPYETAPVSTDTIRERKILVHKKEREKLLSHIEKSGFTLIPLQLYLKNGFAKIKLGVCKGRKKHDKREVLKKRAVQMEIKRTLRKI